LSILSKKITYVIEFIEFFKIVNKVKTQRARVRP